MVREIDLRLTAAPWVQIPTLGLGNLSYLTDAERIVIRDLSSIPERRRLAAESKALPDGSFPIRNVPDLKKAIQAYGRAKNKPKAKRFIIRRARALGRTDLLPEAWGVVHPNALHADAGDVQNGIMVALFPPPEMAAQLAGGQPGDLDPDDLHVTLAYLGTTDDVTPEQLNAARQAIANVSMGQTPFDAAVQGVGTFNAPESDDPQWYSVDAPGLAALRTGIVQALESVGVQPRIEHDFTPHMTVRYGGEQPQIPDGGDQPWPVDGLVLAVGPSREVYPLGHSFVSDADDTDNGQVVDGADGLCALCALPAFDVLHQQDPLPAWMDSMDNPDLLGSVGELVTEDGTVTEFVAAPGPCSLNRSPKHNWVDKVGGLPNYICQVARAVARGGKSLESAIPIAVATMKRWAAGGNHNGKKVSAGVQARAAAALAEWEAKRAKAHATHMGETAEFIGHWKHGWIPVDAAARKELKDEKEAARRKRLAEHRAKNAAKDEDTRKRYEAHRAKNAARDEAMRQRLAAHRAAAHSLLDDVEIEFTPIDGLSAIDLESGEVMEFAWNPDIHHTDVHARPIAKGMKVKPKTGDAGTVVGNAPARDKPMVQISQPGGAPLSVPPNQLEVLNQESPASLNDAELKARHSAISQDIAGHHAKIAANAQKAVDDPNASVDNSHAQSEIDRLNKKLKPYADEMAKRSGGDVSDTVTASGGADTSAFTYYWDPDTSTTYRVDHEGNIGVFAPGVDEQEVATWQSLAPGLTTVEEVSRLPKIDDEDTLEAILGSSAAALEEQAVLADASAATEEAAPEDTTGRRFRIPIVIPEGVPTGDRRIFADGALEAKECPMPLLWQRETDEGHKKSVIVGRIDKVSRLESGGLGDAEGVFDTSPEAQEAARLVRERYLTGVSGDVDQFEHELSQNENGDDQMLIKHGRLVAATLVAKPAFQEATIEMIPEEGETPVITASAGPLLPPRAWFFKPSLDGPTMLTVTDEGRVFGHIAEWGTPHMGNPQLKPPRSASKYRYFNRKPLRTAEGEEVKVGNLTLVGGHAKLSYDPDRAVKHYDDTRSAVADVVAGEDEFGIWVAGAMRPDVTPEQVRAFRASEPSGDWRMRDGHLELCAICQVNVPGFPVTPRALVASGEVVALVAAGMVGHDRQRLSVQETLAELQAQVAELRAEREAQRRATLLEAVQSLRK